MFDPISLIGVATTAFKGIKAAVEMGREIEDVVGQLGQWAGAIADLDKAEELNKKKKKSLFKSLVPKNGKSLEQEAIDVYVAKKRAREMRDELRQLISYSSGINAWNEFLSIENNIRKQRQEAVYAEIERREKLKEFITIGLIVTLVVGTAIGIVWLGIAIQNAHPSPSYR
jgi:hypothetical protein